MDKLNGMLNGVLTLAVYASALLVMAFSGWLVWDLVSSIADFRLSFLTQGPEDSGRAGGISTIIVSTLWILLICLAVAVPLAVGSAIYLSEFANPRGTIVRLVNGSVNLLASVPSVVFGLFGMVLFCQILGFGFSILAGGLTLACMVMPLLFAIVFSGLRSAPDSLRTAAAATGLSKTTMVWRLMIPQVKSSILVGSILATARALSETAALLFTSGYVMRMPESVFDSGRSLSVHIYSLALNVADAKTNARLTALVLLVLLAVINVGATYWFSSKEKRSRWVGQ